MTGCLSQRYQDELMEELPEVDGVHGHRQLHRDRPRPGGADGGGTPHRFGDIDHTEEDGARIPATPSYTAYLKIAEGCRQPAAPSVSSPSSGAATAAGPWSPCWRRPRAWPTPGVKELIVIAQDITRYGIDLYGQARCWASCSPSCASCPSTGFGCTTSTPTSWTTPSSRSSPVSLRSLNYIDIPLQHINDGILKRMCRRSTKAEILALLAKLRDRLPGLVLRTSLICGLPGEGKAEFEELCEFLREARIERAGIFQFSPEEGTPAAEMGDQVDAGHRRAPGGAGGGASVPGDGRLQRGARWATVHGGAVRGL
ncbi:MAG: radical SAM protein [Flavonifractor plautii]